MKAAKVEIQGMKPRVASPAPHADHILLGDTHLQEAVGHGVGEDLGARGVGQVTIQHQQIRELGSQIDESLAEHFAHRYLFTQRVNSCRARSRSCALGTLACQLKFPSIKDTPFPLIVRVTTSRGRVRGARAWRKQSSSAATSWPSTDSTSQPKARKASGTWAAGGWR